MSQWDPDLYLRFQQERTQPALDLVNRIDLCEPGRILDVGCGPGNSTAVLRSKWPHAYIVGVDSSPEMIRKARADYPSGTWVRNDIEVWKPDEEFELVFSNAVLQWIPDQDAVIGKLLDLIRPGGMFAVQVPLTHDSPMHLALVELTKDPRWRPRLAAACAKLNYRDYSYYYNILTETTRDLRIWETLYYHRLDSHDDLIEWYSGTGLRPYLEALSDADSIARFTSELLERVQADYKEERDGKVLFPFNRLFFVATR